MGYSRFAVFVALIFMSQIEVLELWTSDSGSLPAFVLTRAKTSLRPVGEPLALTGRNTITQDDRCLESCRSEEETKSRCCGDNGADVRTSFKYERLLRAEALAEFAIDIDQNVSGAGLRSCEVLEYSN